MSTAKELLVSAHAHPVPDTDTYFIIDPITRRIENTNAKKSVIMQYDHNSERFTFQLPRHVDGHDMLECTSITVNADNIEVETGTTNSDAPDMTDLRPNPDDPETVISSWSISRNLTQLAGTLSFSIEYKCVDSDGNVVYEWSTDTYDGIEVKARKKNGEAAVSEYTDVLEQWRAQIFGAGDSVMANITAEGETQVAAVNTEGKSQVASVKMESETQQEAIELKGANTLESIPEDYTETNNMADEAVRSKSDAIVCESAGESIVLTDSSNDHIRGLKMFGKSSQKSTNGYQLFDASALATTTRGGCTVTNNLDGSFTVSGSGQLTVGFIAQKDYSHEETLKMLKTGTLYALVTQTHPYWYVQIRNTSTVYSALTHSKLSCEITDNVLSDTEMFMRVGFYADSGSDIIPGTINPMLYQYGDGTWEPFTGGIPSPNPDYPQEIESVENTSIHVCGKNLVVNPFKPGYTENRYGVDFTVNADYSISVKGTPTRAVAWNIMQDAYLSVGTYRISGAPTSASTKFRLQVNKTVDGVEKTGGVDTNTGAYVHIDDPDTRIRLYIYVASDAGTVDDIFYPQLELGTKTTEYEKPMIQTLTIPQTLPGIPVLTNGNYTDIDGQQWVCDEIDLERGVSVQRIHKIELNGTEYLRISADNWQTDGMFSAYSTYQDMTWAAPDDPGAMLNCLSTHARPNGWEWLIYSAENRLDNVGVRKNVIHLSLNNNATGIDNSDTAEVKLEKYRAYLVTQYESGTPITVWYPLATPIETPLTAEEITAFKSLRTNYPNTTILNDAGAWMSVKYNADTKSYIENPKILKLTDSSTGVVYELKIVDGTLAVVPV